MKRRPDWRGRFNDYLVMADKFHFAWGFFDCAVMAADGLEAITGERPAFTVEPYTTALGAKKALLSLGFNDVQELAASILIPIDRIREGDLAIMKDNSGEKAFGLIGRGCVHCVSPGVGLWHSQARPLVMFEVPF